LGWLLPFAELVGVTADVGENKELGASALQRTRGTFNLPLSDLSNIPLGCGPGLFPEAHRPVTRAKVLQALRMTGVEL
jgi:hypothetical protein